MRKRLTKTEFLEKYQDIITENQINSLSFPYFEKMYPNRQRLPIRDLKYLFIDLNLSKFEISELVGCTEDKVKSSIYHFKLKKTLKKSIEVQKRTCLRKYGTPSSAMAEQTKRKAKETCLKKYGKENPAQVEKFQQKIKNTNLEKYGYEVSSKSPEVKQKISNTFHCTTELKIKNTCLEKYGADSFWGSKAMDWNKAVKKTKKTCLERYGVDNIMKVPEILEKAKETNNQKYGADFFLITKKGQQKSKETCLEKYGVENPTQNKEIKEKVKQTCINRYGTYKIMSLPEFQQKANKTRKKNNPYKKDSKEEQIIFDKLVTKFEKVEYQYFDEERYPFKCDFYIPKFDLFIEYQGHQSHGKHPFNENDEKDQQIVNYWKCKSKEINYKGQNKVQYLNYIKIWTKRDVLKRETAKKNNLNWIEFFSMKDFDNWLKNI